MLGENLESRGPFYPSPRFRDSRRFPPQRVPMPCSRMPKIAAVGCDIHGNDAMRDELGRIAGRFKPACIIAKEFSMRNSILAIMAVAGATAGLATADLLGAPIAAQAQTVGIV